MKISLNWLREFIEITEDSTAIDQLLTNTGLEVESIEKVDSIPGGLEGFVVAEVLTCEKFEVKDKQLSLTTVDIGSGEPATIVCGAANVAAGQKVIVATVGTTLYKADGTPVFTIDKRKVYGHPSEGMICAEDEIGIGQSHDGILVLDTDLPNGTPAAKYFNLESDYLIEIGLTPNRGDAASHLGVARDIKAVTSRALQLPNITHFVESDQPSPVQIYIENVEDCRRFCGIYLTHVTVGESPNWLKNRLKIIGLNPINNIVDITNYVNHELGQPMHAYDAVAITGGKIIAKNMPEGSKFVTLDGTERSLSATDLMICNDTEGMCIAGVFGGQKSGVKNETKAVFLEVAYFDPTAIRKTSQRHGLKTDASFRFERGTDPELKLFALKRAASLMVELAGATIASSIQDVYPRPVVPKNIDCSYSRIKNLIGAEIPNLKIKSILTDLDIVVNEIDSDNFIATVPAYRVDVEQDIDLVEEVLRIYGFDNVETAQTLGSTYISNFPAIDASKLQTKLSQTLIGYGYSEIQTNSLTNSKYHEAIRNILPTADVKIMNALSEELDVMRQTLLFTGMEVLAYNINRKQRDLKLFEFGKTYTKKEKYKEQTKLGLWLCGQTEEENWQYKSEKNQFHHLYNSIKLLLSQLKISNLDAKPVEEKDMYAYALEMLVNKKSIGKVGLVQAKLAKLCDIKIPVFYAELDWDYLLKQYSLEQKYTEISKYPEVRRDLSLVLDDTVTYKQIETLAQKTERTILKKMNVFDVYQGANLGENKKSYSVSFVLQDEQNTLTDQIIDKSMQKLIDVFEKELGAIIRS